MDTLFVSKTKSQLVRIQSTDLENTLNNKAGPPAPKKKPGKDMFLLWQKRRQYLEKPSPATDTAEGPYRPKQALRL